MPNNSVIDFKLINENQYCVKDILENAKYAEQYTFIGDFNKNKCSDDMNVLFNTKNHCNNITHCNIIDLPNNFLKYSNTKFQVIHNLFYIIFQIKFYNYYSFIKNFSINNVFDKKFLDVVSQYCNGVFENKNSDENVKMQNL